MDNARPMIRNLSPIAARLAFTLIVDERLKRHPVLCGGLFVPPLAL
jgi:hypothetical protein